MYQHNDITMSTRPQPHQQHHHFGCSNFSSLELKHQQPYSFCLKNHNPSFFALSDSNIFLLLIKASKWSKSLSFYQCTVITALIFFVLNDCRFLLTSHSLTFYKGSQPSHSFSHRLQPSLPFSLSRIALFTTSPHLFHIAYPNTLSIPALFIIHSTPSRFIPTIYPNPSLTHPNPFSNHPNFATPPALLLPIIQSITMSCSQISL